SVIASVVTSTLVLAVGLAVLMPKQVEAQSTVIQAKEFDVVDDSGQILATLGSVHGAHGTTSTLVMNDQNGITRIFASDGGLVLKDQQGITRSEWVTNTAEAGGTGMFTLVDK